MTTTTQHAPSIADLVGMLEQTVETVDSVISQPSVQFASGLIPVPFLVETERMAHAAAPTVEGILKYLMVIGNMSPKDALITFLTHGIPTLANSPLLGPVPAIPLVIDTASHTVTAADTTANTVPETHEASGIAGPNAGSPVPEGGNA
jgi:hypothetical protein